MGVTHNKLFAQPERNMLITRVETPMRDAMVYEVSADQRSE